MKTEDFVEPPASTTNSGSCRESGEICSSDNLQQLEVNSPAGNSKEDDGEINMANMDSKGDGTRSDFLMENEQDRVLLLNSSAMQMHSKGTEAIWVIEGNSPAGNSKEEDGEINMANMDSKGDELQETRNDSLIQNEQDTDVLLNSSAMQMHVEVTEAIQVKERLNGVSSQVHHKTIRFEEKPDTTNSIVKAKNGCLEVDGRSPLKNHMMAAISGVRRDRMTFDDQQPSVHVKYNSLTRASKRKLEELLQHWSDWEAAHGSSSHDSHEVMESGEQTFFPAIFVGSKESSAVSFWIDGESKCRFDKELVVPDGDTVPMYDRGFTLGLTSSDGSYSLGDGLENIGDAPRCFNCGSYSHSLKECSKPRDYVAVNNARKNHKAKKNQTVGSGHPVRYYESSRGGKYDDLKAGALVSETRVLLGLQEFDPPPWLNRMREIGYPPGYLASEDDDQPSGITIFGEEEIKDQEDGEIIETKSPELKKKMTVEFPGINAPIPAAADPWRWGPGRSGADSSKSRFHHRSSYSSETDSRGHHGTRLSRDYDDGPPGVDGRSSPSVSNSSWHHSRYSYHSPRERSPVSGRPYSDRKRSWAYDDDRREPYDSPSHSSLNWHSSPRNRGSSRSEHDIDDRYDAYSEGKKSSVFERVSYKHHRR